MTPGARSRGSGEARGSALTHEHDHHHRHDHAGASAADALDSAAAICDAKGLRLTAQRRDVLEAMAKANRPLGAYDILGVLMEGGARKIAPISVYRSLDFLLEAGLIHRLESRNAFVLCPHKHDAGDVVTFLICEGCGAVEEATSPALASALAAIAKGRGFIARSRVIELSGRCSRCQEPASA
jgi:Fur family zinc uptake transcriptional regulator